MKIQILKSLTAIIFLLSCVLTSSQIFAADAPEPEAEALAETEIDESASDYDGEPEGQRPEKRAEAPPLDTNSCSKAFSDANDCCNNPLSCMGAKGISGQDIAGAMSILGTLAALSSQQMDPDQAAQMKQACEIMQIVGAAAGAVNGGGAAICHTKKNACLDACGGIKKEIQAREKATIEYCNSLTDEVRVEVPGCNEDSPYSADLNYANSRIESCETFSANVAAMGQQAVQSGTAASMGQMCASMASSEAPTNVEYGVDCENPDNMTNPVCRDCSDPKNANNPMCRTVDAGDGTPRNLGSTDSFASENGAKGFNNFDGDGQASSDKQGPIFPAGTGNSSSTASAIPNGGGGFAGGAGAALGGGGGGSAGGAGGGYNTDVLGNPMGASGYSGDPGGGYVSASGGFSSYGNGGRRSRSSFDLRQFLPGGKRDPNRKVAGVVGPSSEIGSRHEDIFRRLSKRVKAICKLNRLYDCGK